MDFIWTYTYLETQYMDLLYGFWTPQATFFEIIVTYYSDL